MIEIYKGTLSLLGPKGSIPIREDDEITLKLAMLFEGQCEGLGAIKAAEKFGFTRQRYYQILRQFLEKGAEGLKGLKPGPKGNYRRTDEVVRQIIRYRFLDPQSSPEVIAQKLNQNGYTIAIRSVERVISEYGLQKKTSYLSARNRTGKD
jgi:transposase